MKTKSFAFAFATCFLLLFLSEQTMAQCNSQQSPMSISLLTDANNYETSVNIVDLTTGNTVFTIPQGSQAANTTQTYTTCVNPNHCFIAELLDDAGNGGSNLAVTFLSTSQNTPTGGFGYISTLLMGSAACTDLSPVFDSTSYFIRAAGKMSIGDGNKFNGSIMGNSTNAYVCIGNKNQFNGWIKGDKLALGERNLISGYQGIEMFGNDYGTGVCTQSQGLPGSQLHIISNPMGNTDECEEIEVVPSNNDILLDGQGKTMTLTPGSYGTVTVSDKAVMSLQHGAYSIETLQVYGAKFIPEPGGILCEILISTDKLNFDFAATIEATIDCKAIDIGNDVVFNGTLEGLDNAETLYIGNNNTFSEPTCPPCEEKKKSKGLKRHGSIQSPPAFKLWPNPSDTGVVHFSANGSGRLDIFDLHGKQIQTIDMTANGEETPTSHTLDSQDLKPGMYIGRMTTDDGRVTSQKFTLLGS